MAAAEHANLVAETLRNLGGLVARTIVNDYHLTRWQRLFQGVADRMSNKVGAVVDRNDHRYHRATWLGAATMRQQASSSAPCRCRKLWARTGVIDPHLLQPTCEQYRRIGITENGLRAGRQL